MRQGLHRATCHTSFSKMDHAYLDTAVSMPRFSLVQAHASSGGQDMDAGVTGKLADLQVAS